MTITGIIASGAARGGVPSAVAGEATMVPPPGYSTTIFDDTFAGTSLDTAKWNTYMTSKAAHGVPWYSNRDGGSAAGTSRRYDAEYFEPSQVVVDNGLALVATRGSSTPGYSWTSGVISTYGKFEFDGGYVQIKAKMPAGSGMWPALWMLPGPGARGGDSGEIDIFEGNYTGNGTNPNDNAAWHLHTPRRLVGGTVNTGTNLTAGYNVYGLRWVPGRSLTWYLDGAQIAQVTSAQARIPNKPMELILDLQVADSNACCWITTNNGATPSPSVMEVAEVQVFSSPPGSTHPAHRSSALPKLEAPI